MAYGSLDATNASKHFLIGQLVKENFFCQLVIQKFQSIYSVK